MRKIILGVCILAITVLAGVRSLPAQDAVSELKKLDEQRMKSINDGDIAAVGALLADDYVHVHNTGEVNNKAQYLAFLQAHPRKSSRENRREAMLKNPNLASPDPRRAAHVPKDQAEFLAIYESRLKEIVSFLNANRLVTIPDYVGAFQIRELPAAFKPTSPGGFMNPPGIYDKDPVGFYFIPTYDPNSGNFYIRAAIEDPRPILAHEGIPGHFLQLSIANHLQDEIRLQHADTVFTEGWALYGEEMLSREGLYPDNSVAQAQVLRLSRYRAARIGVDVNLHTGRWNFEQAVGYFMEAGGLDREAAEGEAAGAASSPTQKISYITGKWQIMRLLGRYRDRQGPEFRLGAFHDQLISYGSLPVSVIEFLMLDDETSLRTALQ